MTTEEDAEVMPRVLAAVESNRRHAGWAMVVRGLVAVAFGVVALRSPTAAAGLFVVAFAVFAIADGLLDFFVAARMGRTGQQWGWYVFAGVASIAAGVIALTYPNATLFALVLLIAARAIVVGVLELGAAFSWPELDSRWFLGATGALSIILGVLVFASPIAGGLALIWTIGVYAIVLGAMLFALGVRLAERAHT
jgi:uncharacterized membrane protein HdeD (DUF308 family)